MRPTTGTGNEETLMDPVERTGCETQNDTVLLCYAETKDWRKCKNEVEAFKKCMENYEKQQKQLNKN